MFMLENDRFKFEDKERDFPFYKGNPLLSKKAWIVLLILLIFGSLFGGGSTIHGSIIILIIMILPLLYYLNWDYQALFQKPKAKDILLAIGLFVGYLVYAVAMSVLLERFGLTGGQLIEQSTVTFLSIIPLIFSLMTEEIIKLIPFLLLLRIFYKYTDNRKASIIISMIIVMLMFASLHAYDFKMFLFAIFIQGFGSIFEFIGYIKTKNLLVSYITHLCTDAFIFMIAALSL